MNGLKLNGVSETELALHWLSGKPRACYRQHRFHISWHFSLFLAKIIFFYISSWTSSRLYSPFWFLWHMDAPHLTNIVFLLIILLSTWGLDQIAVDSHSLIFCSCLHGSFNLLKRGNDNNIFNDTSATVIFILTVVGWFLIWYVIRKKSINK